MLLIEQSGVHTVSSAAQGPLHAERNPELPAYDFRCSECQTVFEVVRPIGTTDDEACPACGGKTKRVFSPVGVVFKGSGFHNTDYRPDSGAGSSDTAKSDDGACPSADSSSSACSECPSAPGND
jgi:putative FmdB family regulatory protein